MKHPDIEVHPLLSIARKAGEEMMKIYNSGFSVDIKEDRSPVTEADRKANAVIIEELQKLYPEIPFISEETQITPFSERKHWKRFWLIDPLDGTKEFVKRNGEFTINIALVDEGVPVIGVVYAPAKDVLYYATKGVAFKIEEGKETKLPATATHYSTKKEIKVVASRSHLSVETMRFVEELKKRGKQVNFVSSGSSLKICFVADETADVYPRFGPTMEWDTAAAHAIALCTGRNVLNAETRQPLQYNKENIRNPFFIVE